MVVVCLCAICLFLFIVSKPAEASEVTQEITLTIDPSSGTVRGTTTLTFLNLRAGRAGIRVGSSVVLEHVILNERKVSFPANARSLTLDLIQGTMNRAVIAFRGRYDMVLPGRALQTEDPSSGVHAAVTAKGTYLGAGAGWHPVSSLSPDKISLTVHAPEGTAAVTQGRLVSVATKAGVTTSTWEISKPVESLSLSAGPFVIKESRFRDIPVYTFLYGPNASLARTYLDAVKKYLALYEEKIGPYPFEKFAVVENFLPTGYAFPSYTLIGGEVLRLPFISSTSLGHEVLHSWFGSGVRADYRKGNWTEGLVTYLADYLYEELKSPEAAAEYRLRVLSDFATLIPEGRDFPVRDFTSRTDPTSRTIGYGKVAMLFHMTRRLMGDERFYNALKDFYRSYLFKTASWDDVVTAFEKQGGREVRRFLSPWLSAKGAPEFSADGLTCSRRGQEWVVSGSLHRRGADVPALLQVTIEGRDTGEYADHAVTVQSSRTAFSVPVPFRPRGVRIDPESHVFRRLAPEEIPYTINRIKGSQRLIAVVTSSYKGDHHTVAALLSSLGQGKAAIVQESSLDPSKIRDADILVFGVPRTSRLPVSVPDGFSLSGTSFSIGQERFDSPSHALFVAASSPFSSRRAIAFFVPLSREAADKTLTKITHYGTYAHLVFSDGTNIRKERPSRTSKLYKCGE